MPSKDQRTEKATQHKLIEARKKGNVFRNKDIVIATVFLCEIVLIKWNLSNGFQQFHNYFSGVLDQVIPREFTIAWVQQQVSEAMSLVGMLVGPPLALVVVFGFLGYLAQGGWNMAFEGLRLNPSRLVPKNNFTRVFSGLGLFELFKNVALFLIIARLAWTTLSEKWPDLPQWSYMSPSEAIGKTMNIVYGLAWEVGIAFIIIAAVHFYIQKQNFELGVTCRDHFITRRRRRVGLRSNLHFLR